MVGWKVDLLISDHSRNPLRTRTSIFGSAIFLAQMRSKNMSIVLIAPLFQEEIAISAALPERSR